MKSAKLTATTTATKIVSGSTGSANVPVQVCLRNPSAATQTLWVGGDTVNTTDKGFPIYAGESYSANLVGEDLWIVADGNQDFYLNVSGVPS